MPEFSIVKTTITDLSELRALELTCFPEDAWTLLDIIYTLTSKSVYCCKAVSGDVVAGYAATETDKQGIGWITTVCVRPEYRRMGAARMMLSACETHLHANVIRLCVSNTNYDAITLYNKIGYREIGLWPDYYDSGRDALVMEKE